LFYDIWFLFIYFLLFVSHFLHSITPFVTHQRTKI